MFEQILSQNHMYETPWNVNWFEISEICTRIVHEELFRRISVAENSVTKYKYNPLQTYKNIKY